MIHYGHQFIDENDIEAVASVLRSDHLTQGPQVPEFEREVAALVGSKHAVASSSATASLHIACLALGIGPGDIVWTSAISFVASANCAVYTGAKVDFLDVELDTFNIDLNLLEEKLVEARKLRQLPKAVIVVHLGGVPLDMKKLGDLRDTFGFHVIEDASHAFGAKSAESAVGDCRWSDITIFSFHPVKIVTSAEGGIATTNNYELAKRMTLFRSHGITRYPNEFENSNEGDWYYEQVSLGFNYRMNEMQAALGRSQLKKVGDFNSRREAIADQYRKTLVDHGVDFQLIPADVKSALHLFIIQVPAQTRKIIFDKLRSNGIGVNVHYLPIYRHPFYQKFGFKRLERAELYYSRAISLPIHPGLTEDDQSFVVEALLGKTGYQTIF